MFSDVKVIYVSYVNKLYFPRTLRLYLCPRAPDKGLVNIYFLSLFASQCPFSGVYCILKRLKRITSDFWCKARRQSLTSTSHQSIFVGNAMVSSRREVICSRTWKKIHENKLRHKFEGSLVCFSAEKFARRREFEPQLEGHSWSSSIGNEQSMHIPSIP